jgi:DNA-binding response OmpR family regulator
MHKILIVEDDETIAKIVGDQLVSWGLKAKEVVDFKEVINELSAYQPDLVLLDINLPFFNGFHWCREIRKFSNVPIIFLSSAADNMNMLMAINMGADDFIAKPFDISLLVAKVQALLRRTYDFSSSSSLLTHGEVILNLNDATLVFNDQKLELTKNDFRILQLLMEQKGKVISREDIMQRLWESKAFIDDNTLTVNMTRLRKKLEQIGLENFITTKKGLGYMVD